MGMESRRMNNTVFLCGYREEAKCRYCGEIITYHHKHTKRGYSYKKCPGCGRTNGIAIDMTGEVVTFKVGKDE